jgi:hemerythrin-like domain-containing protein
VLNFGERLKELIFSQISADTVGVATEMTLAHNLLLRNLNAIYLQATGVKEPADIADFITMCQIWWETVHHHHSTEEELFFPVIEEYTGEKGLMEVNVNQHAAFEAGVERFKVYVFKVTPETYDGKIVKEIIKDFGPVLHKHLTEEIDSLLALDKFGGDKLEKTYRELDAKIVASITDKVFSRPFRRRMFVNSA